MSDELPRLDSDVLRTATAAFDDAAESLSRLRADEPVGDVAVWLGQLGTAESCRQAQAGIISAVTAAVESARQYSESLDAAARAYSNSDQSVADEIAGVDIPN